MKWSTLTTNGMCSRAFFTMLELGHCEAMLPLAIHMKLILVGWSAKTISPNWEKGMEGYFWASGLDS